MQFYKSDLSPAGYTEWSLPKYTEAFNTNEAKEGGGRGGGGVEKTTCTGLCTVKEKWNFVRNKNSPGSIFIPADTTYQVHSCVWVLLYGGKAMRQYLISYVVSFFSEVARPSVFVVPPPPPPPPPSPSKSPTSHTHTHSLSLSLSLRFDFRLRKTKLSNGVEERRRYGKRIQPVGPHSAERNRQKRRSINERLLDWTSG